MTTGRTIRAAVDVGGTFTDLVSFSTEPAGGAQAIVTAKSDTTPPAFEQGVMDVLGKSGVAIPEIAFLAHGTTVVINALTERKGVRTGLITTRGFRDSLEIARGNRPDFFNVNYVKPPPFVPRYLRREVPGRMDYRGRERIPLDLSGLEELLADFRREGVEAVAICLLHAYANPAHEEAVLAGVRELWPEVSVVASHQITREWREYERSSTTALSAYVQPVAERYLGRLARARPGRRVRRPALHHAVELRRGVARPDERGADHHGRVGSRERLLGRRRAGPADRRAGHPRPRHRRHDGEVLAHRGRTGPDHDRLLDRAQSDLGGVPDHGAGRRPGRDRGGGGSIACVDDVGKLRVGPRSAGAVPGPAAYGRGGTSATTTDANLALGRINADFFCGGEVEADMAAVDRALGELAARRGGDARAAARGIVRIANDNMVNALKLVSLNRGYDPRDFTLVAFGGGGGMHAVALASELGIRKVVVPRAADVFSAWGMLMSDLRRDVFVTRVIALREEEAGAIGDLLEEVSRAALGHFAAEAIPAGEVRIERYGNLRYANQEHTVEVPLPDGPIDDAAVATIASAFHAAYEREYTYRLDAPVEFVGVHVVATAEVGKLAPAALPSTGRAPAEAIKGRRDVDYADDGEHPADVYDGDLLEPGMRFPGPAVVETKGTTTVIHPGNRVTVDRYGNLVIRLGDAADKGAPA